MAKQNASYGIATREVFRVVVDGKQNTVTSEFDYHIGEVRPLTLTSLYPANVRQFHLIPWAYKRATDAQIASGNYRIVRKGDTTYTLATDKDGNCRPLTLTSKQLVQLVSDALQTCATSLIREGNMVGMHFEVQPIIEWSATSKAARKGSNNTDTNRKNRHGRNAKADAAKQARAAKRAATRKSANAAK